jgi:SMODS domain-containing protein
MTTSHEYLDGVLLNQRLSEAELQPLREAQSSIEAALRKVYGSAPTIYYGGSYGKKTMIKAAYDLDIVVYFPDGPANSRDLYLHVYQTLVSALYRVKPKNVALRVLSHDRFHIDVVPARAQDKDFYRATVFNSETGAAVQTSIKRHIDSVKDYRDVIKLMKLWRIRQQLDWDTFALEQTTIRALRGVSKNDYGDCLDAILTFISDNILSLRLEDPANRNNIIEIPPAARSALKQAAIASRAAPNWVEIIW